MLLDDDATHLLDLTGDTQDHAPTREVDVLEALMDALTSSSRFELVGQNGDLTLVAKGDVRVQ